MKLKSTLAAALFLTASLTAASSSFADNGGLSATQKKEVNQLVHDYLINNPSILIEMSQKLQENQMAKVKDIQDKAQKVIPAIAAQLFQSQNSPIAGNAQGNISLVEFFDYQCSHCKDMVSVMNNLSKKNKDLRIVYKELPIFGGNSDTAARAALAAKKQNKYEQLHTALMQTENPINKDKIFAAAKSVGINVEQLKKDMNSKEVKDELKQNMTIAQKLQLLGTPAFVVGFTNHANQNSVLVPGVVTEDTLQMVITKVQNNKT